MKNNILLYAFACIFAGAGFASAADYQWVGANTTWATVGNWNVWNGSAWVVSTATPSNGDSILGNTSTQQMNQPAALTLSTLQITTGGVQYVANTALTVDTIRSTLSSAASAFIIRGTGLVKARLLDIEVGALNFGSGGNAIGGLTVSEGVIIKGNLNIAVSSSAQAANLYVGNYSLGVLTFSAGNFAVALAQTGTQNTWNLAANATVSGLVTENSATGRILAGGSGNTSPGSNTANLYINVASGQTYSGAVALQDVSTTSPAVKTNTLSVIKVGQGMQILTSSTSNYTGGTTVSVGTLFVNNTAGSGLGYGNAVVQSGARLGGSGIIALSASNTLTIASGGILLAGNGSTGTSLTVKNALYMANDAILEVTLGASGTSSTLVVGTGGSLSADSIILSILDSGVTEGTYSLITGLSADPNVSTWTVTGLDPLLWSTLLSYNAGTVAMTLTAVPEPAMTALAVGLLSLIWVARRRRS